jgi:hypothetical protein
MVGGDELETRPHALIRAISGARLETRSCCGRRCHPWTSCCTIRCSRTSTGITSADALHREIEHRARRYGMSFDQYVIAVLGHLAWRTPFAEDLEPEESWYPDRADLASVSPITGQE